MSNDDKITRIYHDDTLAEEVGKRLAWLLALRMEPPYKLYDTSRGYKNAAGLARCVLEEIGLE